MTPVDDANGPGRERSGRDDPGLQKPSRAELERQIRDHRRSWRDQPKGLGCLVISGFMVLTTIAFVIGLVLLIATVR